MRELARVYAHGRLDEDTYRRERARLLDGITVDGQPIQMGTAREERSETVQVEPVIFTPSYAAPEAQGKWPKVVLGAVASAVLIGAGIWLFVGEPEPVENMPSQKESVTSETVKVEVQEPVRKIDSGRKLISIFLDTMDWRSSGLSFFEEQWHGLSEEERVDARRSANFEIMGKLLREHIELQESLGGASDWTDQDIEALKAFARRIGLGVMPISSVALGGPQNHESALSEETARFADEDVQDVSGALTEGGSFNGSVDLEVDALARKNRMIGLIQSWIAHPEFSGGQLDQMAALMDELRLLTTDQDEVNKTQIKLESILLTEVRRRVEQKEFDDADMLLGKAVILGMDLGKLGQEREFVNAERKAYSKKLALAMVTETKSRPVSVSVTKAVNPPPSKKKKIESPSKTEPVKLDSAKKGAGEEKSAQPEEKKIRVESDTITLAEIVAKDEAWILAEPETKWCLQLGAFMDKKGPKQFMEFRDRYPLRFVRFKSANRIGIRVLYGVYDNKEMALKGRGDVAEEIVNVGKNSGRPKRIRSARKYVASQNSSGGVVQ